MYVLYVVNEQRDEDYSIKKEKENAKTSITHRVRSD